MPLMLNRRHLLTTVPLATAAALVRAPPSQAADGGLEITTVRLPKFSSICVSPQYAAEELLRAEGFTDIRYVDTPASAVAEAIGQDKIDFGLNYAALVLPAIDGGQPVTVLAGVHVGCFELFAKDGIHNVADLKGRTVGLQDWGSPAHVLVALMAAHVGLNPATDIRWVTDPSVKPIEQFVEGKIDAFMGFPPQPALGRGEFDFTMSAAATQISALDIGIPITIVAGLHAGCYELFAHAGIRGITDLKGKRVGLLQSPPALLIMLAASVGLDRNDIEWVSDPSLRPLDLFADGRLDAFLAFPPEPQMLRARQARHVIVNTALDRPWSQYFCCMLVGNREFVRKNPVAAKRAVRAILKATDLCDRDPQRAARVIVDRGFADEHHPLLQTLKDNPYKWREYNAEDTVRFYALRLQEVGLIKSSPQKIIADGTDWRFLNELKRELKA
jgi:NitT/TauT family transport system substrate-binding protein